MSWGRNLFVLAIALAALLVVQVRYGTQSMVGWLFPFDDEAYSSLDEVGSSGADSPPEEVGREAGAGDGNEIAAPHELPPLASLTATVERPLFTPGRRPPEAAPPEVVQAAPALAPAVEFSFSLSAIAVSEAERVAYFVDADVAGLTRVAEGEEVQGWTLKEVKDDRVVLVRGRQTQDLALRTFRPAPNAGRAERRLRRNNPRAVRLRDGDSRARRRRGREAPEEDDDDMDEAEDEDRADVRRNSRRSRRVSSRQRSSRRGSDRNNSDDEDDN